MRLGLAVVLAAVAIAGCGGDDAASFGSDTEDFIDVSTPPGNCSADTGAEPCPTPGSSGSPEGGPCLQSSHCLDGGWCVAPFDDGEVGDFTCTSVCIDLDDETAWCLDDSACCAAGAVCSARGLCIIPESGLDDSGSGTDSGSSTGSDTGSGTDTGTSTGETEGSGESGSGGSETGAATGTTTMR